MKPIHIMLDTETWGTTPGSDLRSIGACVFYPDAKAGGAWEQSGERTFYAAVDNPILPTDRWPGDSDYNGQVWDEHRKGWVTYPLTRDPQTVQWWNDQSAEAQAAFADPIDLWQGLMDFRDWIALLTFDDQPELPVEKRTNLRLWSHGANFDPGIMEAAYRACGVPVPWHYRSPRDTRTIFDAAGIDDHSAWLAQHPGPLGIQHHALDDAICQARAVCAAYGLMRISHDVRTHREDWRNALMNCMTLAGEEDREGDCAKWQHEIIAFDRTFEALAQHPGLEL